MSAVFARALFTALRQMDAEANTLRNSSPTGLNFYGGFHRPHLKRPPTETSWTQRLAVLLTASGFPTVAECRYPGSRKKCDNVVTLPGGGKLWLENKGAWKQWWIEYGKPQIYRSYLLHPLVPGLVEKSHTAPQDLNKLLQLTTPDATAVGFLLIGFDKVGHEMDADVAQFARLAGIDCKPWCMFQDCWPDPYRPAHRVCVWYWHRNLVPFQGSLQIAKNRRILPRPDKGQSLKVAMEQTNKQYAGTLAKLAKWENSQKN